MPANSLHDLFYRVLNEYGTVFEEVYRTKKFDHPFGSLIRKEIPEAISAFPEIDNAIYRVEGKCGIGQWASVPYIPIFDKRITTSAKKGAYIVYLINKDKKEMTLAFGIGTTEGIGMYQKDAPAVVASSSKKLKPEQVAALKAKCDEIREKIGMATRLVYDETNNVGAEGYDAACVYNKKYKIGSLPDDTELKSDLMDFLDVYKRYYDIYLGGEDVPTTSVLDHWPSGARDTTEFPKVSIEVDANMRDHLKAFTQMDGIDWTDYDTMNEVSGASMTGSRLRTYRKMYEKFGLIMRQEEKLKLSRLGHLMASLETDLNSKKEEVLEKLRATAIDILSRYQLKNPVDNDPLPVDCDVLPAICIWKAMRVLDNKLHPEEVNRVLLRVMKMEDLDDAIATIKAARELFSGKYANQNDDVLREALGVPVHTEQIQARIAPWFSFLGWGGLIIEQAADAEGYRNLVDKSIAFIDMILEHSPEYYAAKDEADWLMYYIGNDSPILHGYHEMDVVNVKDAIRQIKEYIASKGFSYKDSLIDNFFLSLKSKPFVILAGTSGTGKTRLVKLFAEAIDARYFPVSVRPDWSDSSDLFGHTNLSGDFIPGPICEAFDVAIAEPSRPVILCLDEMNLARVEYYLSDFLSVIELRERDMYGGVSTTGIAQYAKGIPDNLYIVGTVNMDETTFPFSKKVLDRANTIEFNYVDLIPTFDAMAVECEKLKLNNSFLRTEYLVLSRDCADERDYVEKICVELQKLNKILVSANAHIGYRVRDEIVFYMLNNKKIGFLLPEEQALDNEIMQKILPRIQGSSTAIKTLLIDMFKFCMGSGAVIDADTGNVGEQMKNAAALAKYPESAQKIGYMMARFEDDGFTSYWL